MEAFPNAQTTGTWTNALSSAVSYDNCDNNACQVLLNVRSLFLQLLQKGQQLLPPRFLGLQPTDLGLGHRFYRGDQGPHAGEER